jgi:hypothetical protein
MVVVIIWNVVVDSKVLATTYFIVVVKLTTGNCAWSLIVLVKELSTTMDDHILVVANNF